MIGNEQSVNMEHRQRVEQNITIAKSPVVHQNARIGSQVAMRHHRSLGAPGGPGGVDDNGEIVRPGVNGFKFSRLVCRCVLQGALSLLIERQHLRASVRKFAHQIQ